MSNYDQINSLRILTGFINNAFTLLYRASRDGFEAESFHSNCNSHANTITLIQTTNLNIFGGFASVPWSSDGSYTPDSNAYLFSLVNPINSLPQKLSIIYEQNGLVFNPSYGPTFGGGHDLYISDCSNMYKSSYTHHNSYQVPDGFTYLDGEQYFQTIEIEVYSVE